MVKIRLMRIGAKRRPFYRIVAVDERKKRTGAYLENLGTYNPLTTPHEVNLKQDRIDEWVKKGAILSVGFLRVIGKAPQRAPRKAKKEKKETPAPKAPEETKTEEIPLEAESAPAEQSASEETPETPGEEAPVEETPTEEPEKPNDQSEEEKSE